MAYLILNDYFATIQEVSLQQILCDEDAFRLVKQETALSEIKSYLVQKYDVSDEFRDTVKFSYTRQCNAKQLVYLDADDYMPTSTYGLNALTFYSDNVYYCNAAITVAEPFNLNHWTLLGPKYTLFYIPTPYPEFDYKGFYGVGDVVFWKDKIYHCNKSSAVNTQQSSIQYASISEIPYTNQFPGITVDQWSAGVPYSLTNFWPVAVPTDFTEWDNITSYVISDRRSHNSVIWQAQANNTNVEPGADITKWLPVSYTQGDNRNSQLVEMNVIISIYKLSPRISPRNIPDIWVKNYDDAIKWLKNVAKGNDITADLPVLQPAQGRRIRHGGNPRLQNGY
jgi:phage gp36-like protein